jgi:hypothetical protein
MHSKYARYEHHIVVASVYKRLHSKGTDPDQQDHSGTPRLPRRWFSLMYQPQHTIKSSAKSEMFTKTNRPVSNIIELFTFSRHRGFNVTKYSCQSLRLRSGSKTNSLVNSPHFLHASLETLNVSKAYPTITTHGFRRNSAYFATGFRTVC